MKDDKRSSERESAQAKPAQATRDRAQDKARCRRTTTRPNTGVNRNDSIRSLVSSASAATTSPTSLKLSENLKTRKVLKQPWLAYSFEYESDGTVVLDFGRPDLHRI